MMEQQGIFDKFRSVLILGYIIAVLLFSGLARANTTVLQPSCSAGLAPNR